MGRILLIDQRNSLEMRLALSGASDTTLTQAQKFYSSAPPILLFNLRILRVIYLLHVTYPFDT